MNRNTNLETKLSCLLIGGGIGAVLALLFAPKAGQDLRADIAGATRAGLDKTETMVSHLSEKATTVYEDTAAKAGEIYDSARQKVNAATTALSELPGQLQDAAQAKAQQISSTLEAGKNEKAKAAAVTDAQHSPDSWA